MKEFLANFWAAVRIFFSNFNATFGDWINFLLIAAVVVFFTVAIIRCFMASVKAGRNRKALEGREPDAEKKQRAAQRLQKAVQIPSVAGDRKAMADIAAYLRECYEQAIPALRWVTTEDGSLLIRWAGQDEDLEPVLFCGHMDIAPVQGDWVHAPFGGEIDGDMLYGRGAVAGKSTIITMLEAVENLSKNGFTPRRDVYFALGSDETSGGKVGAAGMAEVFRRRGMRFAAVVDEGGWIVEDHMGAPNHAAAIIGLGEKQSCDFVLEANVKGGDSSVPGHRTALGSLAEAICRMDGAQPHHHLSSLTREYLNRSMYALPFAKRLVISNMPLSEPLLTWVFRDDRTALAQLRSTVTATQISGSEAANMLAAKAQARINARLITGENPENMLRYLRELVEDLPVTMELVDNTEAVPVTDAEAPMYKVLCNAIGEVYPALPCIGMLCPGKTDSRHYADMSDCILRFAPLVQTLRQSRGAYRAEEHVSLHALGVAVEIYENFFKKL